MSAAAPDTTCWRPTRERSTTRLATTSSEGSISGSGVVAFNVEGIYRNFEATVVDTDDDFPEIEDEVHFDLSGIGVQAGVIFRF